MNLKIESLDKRPDTTNRSFFMSYIIFDILKEKIRMIWVCQQRNSKTQYSIFLYSY